MFNKGDGRGWAIANYVYPEQVYNERNKIMDKYLSLSINKELVTIKI